MPCAGPSDYELRAMEAGSNLRKFGKKWNDHELVENVACAYTDHVRFGTPLPKWASLWSDDHIAKDKARKMAETKRREAKEEEEYQQYVKLAKKFKGVR